ncbi:porin [Sulfitobacter sp. F26204]|uniref:porin n=1 Tax=Sulfitobacter sp. F26204 TaxID=2996014 RepID=UPI00225E2E78|nr:porin [Sulfitobacter sp. F26204]MCX7561317.1 porin [Sulfitobacter sp. F26204]
MPAILCRIFLIAAVMLQPHFARADDTTADKRFIISAELELGVEANVKADDTDSEVRDVFLSGELELAFALTERITLFSELSLESVTDAEQNRAFDDIALFVGTLGLSFDLDPVTLSIGKISPAFGSAWDTAPGYFGTAFAEDYELEEMIGLSAELELGAATLTLSAFYPDDTRLSDSFGTRRGRNDPRGGDVGNTGKLNNFALQYDREINDTTLHFGLRHLARGEEDNDENAIALGLSHNFGDEIEVIAELAHFNGWEGSEAKANIATLGASLRRGAYTWSAAVSKRGISDTPSDHMIALGVDYQFDNGMTLSAGYARIREEEENNNLVALSIVIPID